MYLLIYNIFTDLCKWNITSESSKLVAYKSVATWLGFEFEVETWYPFFWNGRNSFKYYIRTLWPQNMCKKIFILFINISGESSVQVQKIKFVICNIHSYNLQIFQKYWKKIGSSHHVSHLFEILKFCNSLLFFNFQHVLCLFLLYYYRKYWRNSMYGILFKITHWIN